MTTAIFIRTYAGDADWLQYCLKSIRKYCSGFMDTILAFPEKDAPLLTPMAEQFECPFFYSGGDQPGYLCQQATKMQADNYTSADYIMFVDSDCVFFRKCNPEDFFVERKPMMLVAPYETVGDAKCWQPLTERMLGFPCPMETMRRHPSVWHRSTLVGCREFIQAKTGRTIRQAVMESGGFSEFNTLGAWALKHQPDAYRVIDVSKEQRPPDVLKQFWSHSRITGEERRWINQVLR